MSQNMDVCRICLATDVRMFTIADTPLQPVFEKIANTPLIVDQSRPVVACYICYRQLSQCHELMRISHQAQELLVEILAEFPEVTPDLVAMIDRKTYNLGPPLTITRVKYFDNSTIDTPIVVKDQIDLKDRPEFKNKDENVAEKQAQSGPVCRICLATNIRMFTIAGTPLQFVYENLTDNLLQTDDKRPMTACYICCARLKKCRKLMLRSSKAEKVLTAIMEKYAKMSTKAIAMIDRETNNLCDSLKIRSAECFDSLDEQPTAVDKNDCMVIEVKIEVEPDLYVGSPQATDMLPSDVEDDGTKISNAEHGDAWAVDVNAVQQGEASIEAPKPRKRRKCTEKTKNTSEKNPDEPKKEKPRRVYKKRIRAYIHVCEICHRVFNRTNHLKDHMKIHTDDRPYECSVCQRRFIQKINLKNHIMTHTGEKPYECDLCSSSFIAKSDFKRHMNTHNEERNFECSLCHRRFTQLPYLKAHISTHTSEKPYECHICQRRFSQKPYLKNHLKRHVDRERD